jgi:peptidoglycan/LPS O-acetylase OafA/YrhL
MDRSHNSASTAVRDADTYVIPGNLAFSAGAATVAPPRERLDYIDALRGAAALWIVAFHFFESNTDAIQQTGLLAQPIAHLVHFGQLGVNLFLVISGFCLYYPLVRRRKVPSSPIDLPLKRYFARRAERILPPYYALVLLVTLYISAAPSLAASLPWLPRAGNDVTLQDLVTHLLLIHNLFPQSVDAIATPLWSIALECQLYVVFPLLVALGNRRGIWPVAAVALLVSGACQTFFWLRYGLPAPVPLDLWRLFACTYWSMPGRLFEFVAGMVAAAYVGSSEGVSRRISGIAFAIFIVSLIAGLWQYDRFGAASPPVNPTWGIIFAALIVLLGRVHQQTPRVLRPLVPVTWVGGFSYSLYLTHATLLTMGWSYVSAHPMTVLQAAEFVLLVVFPIALACAYIFHRLFERPFMAGGRARQRPSGSPPNTVRQRRSADPDSEAVRISQYDAVAGE